MPAMRIDTTIIRSTMSLILFLASSLSLAAAEFAVTETSRADFLVRQLLIEGSSGTPQVGSVRLTGGANCAATFQELTLVDATLPDSGIVLSTGHARDAIRSPSYTAQSAIGTAFDTDGDADLDGILAKYGRGDITYDACVLEFDFTCGLGEKGTADLDYFLLSNEAEAMSQPSATYDFDNDIFAVFFNDRNIALLPGDQAVCIDELEALGFLNQNTGEVFSAAHYTDPLMAVGTNGVIWLTNTVKIVIADVGDEYGDTSVFLKAGAFSCVNPRFEPAVVGPPPETVQVLSERVGPAAPTPSPIQETYSYDMVEEVQVEKIQIEAAVSGLNMDNAAACTIACSPTEPDKRSFCIRVQGLLEPSMTSVCVTVEKLKSYNLEGYSTCGCCLKEEESYHPSFCGI